jgi:hypothetical protein
MPGAAALAKQASNSRAACPPEVSSGAGVHMGSHRWMWAEAVVMMNVTKCDISHALRFTTLNRVDYTMK